MEFLRKANVEKLAEAAAGYVAYSALRHKRALGVVGLALFLASLKVASVMFATNGDEPPVEAKDPKIVDLENFLNTPKEDGQVSFLEQMRTEGASVHVLSVLGKKPKVASAGAIGLLARPLPSRDHERFPEQGRLNWGECIVWDEYEVITVNPDQSIDLFAPTPHGTFFRLYTVANGQTIWHVRMDDPGCQDLLDDGSSIYDRKRKVIGPSAADRAVFK